MEEETRENANEIWNPAAAVNWSLVLTPAFGPVLHYLNWKDLGEEGRERPALIWAGIFCVLVGLSLFDFTGAIGSGPILFAYLLLFVWYFATARKQIKYVRERFGKTYSRKDWFQPIGAALAIIVFSGFIPSFDSDEKPVSNDSMEIEAGEIDLSQNEPLTATWHNGEVFSPEFVIAKLEDKSITFRQGPEFGPTKC